MLVRHGQERRPIILLADSLLTHHSGCPPGSPSCPADLPALPSDLIQVIVVTTVCGAALLLLALAFALLNIFRGWRWLRFTYSAVALVLSGVFLFVAGRAQEAWQPFASLHMSNDASYNDWVTRISSATLYGFVPTIVRFRGLMMLGIIVTLTIGIVVAIQGRQLLRQRKGGL